jgi:hypothetical protein
VRIGHDLLRFGLLRSHRHSLSDTDCLAAADSSASACPGAPPSVVAPCGRSSPPKDRPPFQGLTGNGGEWRFGWASTIAKLLPNCVILSDAWNHNSMIEGVRRAGLEKKIWRHNDVGHLEELLAAEAPERPKLVVFEALYSMDVDIAPVNRMRPRGALRRHDLH